MSNARIWLFRVLVIGSAGLMLLSWFMPWWKGRIIEILGWVQIRPWGLEHNLQEYTGYIAGAEMPAWFAPLIWAYLGLCIGLLLFSLFASEKRVGLGKFKLSLPHVIIGGVGLSYIVVVVLAVIIAAIRTGDFYGIHLIGKSFFSLGYPIEGNVEAGFLFGYWLACGVGPLLIVLALLRNKIIGKAKLITR